MTSFLIEKKTPQNKTNQQLNQKQIYLKMNKARPPKGKEVIIRLYNEGNNVLVYEFQHIQVIK